jgi:TRAP-type mannitol/chloroaromatic compound transport system permease small subunit
MNSTQLQESEYWFHTFLFALVIGYAYTRQAHVRIDLIRDRVPIRTKYAIEIAGIVFFLLTYAGLGTWFTFLYTQASYFEGESSKSTIGLSHIWVVKSALPAMFVLLGLAGISQLIKAVAGFRGLLPDGRASETLGGDL